MKARAFWALSALALGLLAAGVIFLSRDGGSLLPETRRGDPIDEIVVAYPQDSLTLDPYAPEANVDATRDLLRPVLPTLLDIVVLDSGPAFAPGLAQDINDVAGEGTSVTYRLDPDAVWSDGEPIDAADVRFTWMWISDPGNRSPAAAKYARIADVEVVDRLRLRVVFDGPNPGWRAFFGAGDFVLPEHALQGEDRSILDDGPPVSGGPFEITSFRPGLEVEYRPNPRWWGRPPLAERVRVQFVPVLDVALGLFRDGRVDVLATTTEPALTERLEAVGARVASSFGHAWWELGFNVERQSTNELRDRRALAREIDRAALIEALVRDEGRPLQHLLPGVTGVDEAFATYQYDPPAAAADRRQAGGVGTISFSVPSGKEMALLMQRAFITQLDRSGIDAESRNLPAADFYGRSLREGAFDIALWEVRGSPDPSTLVRFHSSRLPPAGSNFPRIRSAPLDAVIERLEREPAGGAIFDPALIDGVMGALAGELPVLPVFETKMFIGYRTGIVGPVPNASSDGPFWNLEDWGAL